MRDARDIKEDRDLNNLVYTVGQIIALPNDMFLVGAFRCMEGDAEGLGTRDPMDPILSSCLEEKAFPKPRLQPEARADFCILFPMSRHYS